MVLNAVLDPIFSPLLALPTLLAVIILSFMISLIITVVYKYTTDQNLMKQLKEEMKSFQKQIKELRSNPEEAMKIQKRAMQTNMKYMMQSMKSTLYSFIPIILIFGWMNANLAYEPIMPNQDFTTRVIFGENIDGQVEISVPDGITINGESKKPIQNSEAVWYLNGERGEYLIEYLFNGKKYGKEILISEKRYVAPVKKVNDDVVRTIEVSNKKNVLINLFGWEMGWLITYIIFAILFSILIRKLMKVY